MTQIINPVLGQRFDDASAQLRDIVDALPGVDKDLLEKLDHVCHPRHDTPGPHADDGVMLVYHRYILLALAQAVQELQPKAARAAAKK